MAETLVSEVVPGSPVWTRSESGSIALITYNIGPAGTVTTAGSTYIIGSPGGIIPDVTSDFGSALFVTGSISLKDYSAWTGIGSITGTLSTDYDPVAGSPTLTPPPSGLFVVGKDSSTGSLATPIFQGGSLIVFSNTGGGAGAGSQFLFGSPSGQAINSEGSSLFITGSVDVRTVPTTTVTATNLDIRDLSPAQDSLNAASILSALPAGTNILGSVISTIPNITGTDGTTGPSNTVSVGGTDSTGSIQEIIVDETGQPIITGSVNLLNYSAWTGIGSITGTLSTDYDPVAGSPSTTPPSSGLFVLGTDNLTGSLISPILQGGSLVVHSNVGAGGAGAGSNYIIGSPGGVIPDVTSAYGSALFVTGSLNIKDSATVTATNLDIRDLSAAQDTVNAASLLSALPAGTKLIGSVVSHIPATINVNDADLDDIPNIIGTDGSTGPTKTISIGGTTTTGSIHEISSFPNFSIDGTNYNALMGYAGITAFDSGGIWRNIGIDGVTDRNLNIRVRSGANTMDVDNSGRIKVNTISSALPAGTNLIGSVVAHIPSVVSIDDNASSLTVDGTISANLNAGTNLIGSVVLQEPVTVDSALNGVAGSATLTPPSSGVPIFGVDSSTGSLATPIFQGGSLIVFSNTGGGGGSSGSTFLFGSPSGQVVNSEGSGLNVSNVPLSFIHNGSQTVTTPGTDVALISSSTASKKVFIQAYRSNTGFIAVGSPSVDAESTSGDGIMLEPGDSFSFDIDDINKINIDATVSGEGVRFVYFT